MLLYHHVGPANASCNELALSVSAAKFDRQVRWLHWRGYKTITPRQWLHSRSSGEPLPGKLVMFTFDDAYADIAIHALPVLERYGFNAVIYAITRRLGNALAWDGMQTMTQEQLSNWASRGFEIGAHTQTHPDLTSLTDDAVLEELRGSRVDLAQAGLEPSSFAYPYGHYNRRVRDSLVGIFPIAMTCEEGMNDAGTDPLQFRRTMVHPGDTLLDLEFRVAIGRSPLDTIRERVRLRSRIRNLLRRAKLLPRH